MGQVILGIKKNLSKLIPISMILGLIIGYYFEVGFFKDYVNVVLFLMIYPMMINLKLGDVGKALKQPKALIISLALNFTIAPILAFAIGKVFFGADPSLQLGLLLIGLLPTSGMTASWTGLADGNLQLALVMMTLNLLASIVMIPLYAGLLLGEALPFDSLSIMITIVRIVLVPMILGDLTRRLLVKRYGSKVYQGMRPYFGNISALGVLVIIFMAIALRSVKIIRNPLLVIKVMIPLFIFYLILLVITHFISKKFFNKKDRIAMVYATSMRNLTIALGIGLGAIKESTSLAVFIIAIAYVVQLPFAVTYLHFISKEPK